MFVTVAPEQGPELQDTQAMAEGGHDESLRVKPAPSHLDLNTGWVYTLNEEEVTMVFEDLELEGAGSIHDLKTQLVQYIRNREYTAEQHGRLTKWSRARSLRPASPHILLNPTIRPSGQSLRSSPDRDSRTPAVSPDRHIPRQTYQQPDHLPAPQNIPFPTIAEPNSLRRALSEVRHWSVRYDGQGSPLDFLERVEEMAFVCDVPLDTLPRLMPELLTGEALEWHRSHRTHHLTWADFRAGIIDFFLPANYREEWEDEIRQRQQKTGEPFRKYALQMQGLMRHLGMTEEDQLERIYRNARHELQLYARRTDFRTLADLSHMADVFERLTRPEYPTARRDRPGPQPQAHPRSTPVTPTPRNPFREPRSNIASTEGKISNVRAACGRCGEEGHSRTQCTNPSRDFCWICGTIGVKTIHCCRKTQGNDEAGRS